MNVIVVPNRAWALERNDRRLHFASGPDATMFAESGPFHVTLHRHPAWKVVLPLGGHVEVGHGAGRTVAATGVIVPPQLAHTCAASAGYVALFLDPWVLCPGLGLARLGDRAARRILAALGHTGTPGPGPGRDSDLAAARAELLSFTGAGRPVDPRVTHAVQECTRAGSGVPVGSLAADVGLSPSRLRTLVHGSVGVPLTRLRQWARLRVAVADLPRESAASAAAVAGFADQAHFTRTARSLLGRTPASIGRSST
ncbi:helix-turn-helix domain-containing protein [Streptomyces sp. NPDC053069]|uniref:helix-turn-helix domain-containing protein n=1 Tax=Streptomyces sp. NPDC053069 TaxID=3365695 RepID=UPI0037D2042F